MQKSEQRKTIDAGLVTAISAGVMSICALGVSIYQAYLDRQQTRAEVIPIVQAWNQREADRFGIVVANKGVGPALIRSVVVTRDSEPRVSWQDTYREEWTAEIMQGVSVSQAQLIGDVLAPGDIVPIVSFSGGAAAAAMHQASAQVELQICYCSVLDDCSLFSIANLRDSRSTTEAVDACYDQPGHQF